MGRSPIPHSFHSNIKNSKKYHPRTRSCGGRYPNDGVEETGSSVRGAGNQFVRGQMLSRALRIARGAFLHPNDRAVETGNPAREAGSRFVREQMLSRFHFLQMGVWRYFCTRMIEWWKLAVLPALLKVVFSESKSAPIFCETVCAAESGRSHSVPSECAPDSEFAPGGAGRACTCFLTPFSQCRGGGSPMAAHCP